MTHQYKISGMTCSGCKAKVESLLRSVDHVKDIRIDLETASAEIDMDRHVPTTALQSALAGYPKYTLEDSPVNRQHKSAPIQHSNEAAIASARDLSGNDHAAASDEKKSIWETYKPVVLIAIYLLTVTLLIQAVRGFFDVDTWMNHFMGGFFLVFSFFKMFDIAGFADSYSMYDIIAKRWKGWGFIYPFVELGLGLLFILNLWPLFTNIITLVVMSLSIVGVLQSVLNKRAIKCACLGAVFNLPMSTITIIEDALMMVMSGIMIIRMLG
ncbi:MAG: heavy-metal-associated domain-containing protein [Sphingobacteriales bacterium]|nr:MAG: heavy-metal-associated domain-containing protein [Sphingobacteriales bacterium]